MPTRGDCRGGLRGLDRGHERLRRGPSAEAGGDGDGVLDERQSRGRASGGRLRPPLQSLPPHETHHASQNSPLARDHDGGGHDRARHCRPRAPERRAHARGRAPVTEAAMKSPDIAAPQAFLTEPLVRAALAEDLGRAGDLTTDTVVPAAARARGVLTARRAGVVAGLEVAATAFRQLDPDVRIEIARADGATVGAGERIAAVSGRARGLLSSERVALNFLCHLSGIATATREIVEAVKGYRTRIACTRKTTPGLRTLEKYAVRVGGGVNHRFGLDDGVLLKDNHIVVAGGIRAAIETAKAQLGHMVKI